MKLLAGIGVLLVAIIAAAFFINYETTTRSEELKFALSELNNSIEEDDWEKALEDSSNMLEKWHAASAWWFPFMDHSEVDLLEVSVTKITKLVDVRYKELALVEIHLAQKLANHIVEMEKPLIRNIF